MKMRLKLAALCCAQPTVGVSTIGFGDLVPLQQGSALQLQPFYVIFTLLFVLLGLAVFSACVNLLVLGFMAPNADVVTAAIREPQSTIVFERFARSGILLFVLLLRECLSNQLLRWIRERIPVDDPIRIKSLSNYKEMQSLGKGRFGEVVKYLNTSKMVHETVKRVPVKLFDHWSQSDYRISQKFGVSLNVSQIRPEGMEGRELSIEGEQEPNENSVLEK
ncbi:hypothetical protein OSTOST_00520 [Ostertagia ostertagi]